FACSGCRPRSPRCGTGPSRKATRRYPDEHDHRGRESLPLSAAAVDASYEAVATADADSTTADLRRQGPVAGRWPSANRGWWKPDQDTLPANAPWSSRPKKAGVLPGK